MTSTVQIPAPLAYGEPRITDYGSVVQLTADFDAQFLGSVAKVVTLAAVSTPMNPGTDMPLDMPDNPGDVLGDDDSGGNDNAGNDNAGNDNAGNDDTGTPPGGNAGDTAGDNASGGPDNGSGGSGGGGVVAAGDGGKLAFTGFPALTFAAAGAAVTTAGMVLRAKLRRT